MEHRSTRDASASVQWVAVNAPAKLNLSLAIGPLKDDGFHELATVFHAVDIFDTVTVTRCLKAERGVTINLDGVRGDVPSGESNLAWRAAMLVAQRLDVDPDVHITIDKRIPIAAGLAGGSADAAAAIAACDELWDGNLDQDEMIEIASLLGSDVAFALFGGTMLGVGRGEQLSPVLSRANMRWVLAVSDEGLSTARVYARLDELRSERSTEFTPLDEATPMISALVSGDVADIGAAMVNDLQVAAIALRPRLRKTLTAGLEAGAVGALVSGSGPTCVFLADGEGVAVDVSVALMSEGVCDRVLQARGPASGALANITRGML